MTPHPPMQGSSDRVSGSEVVLKLQKQICAPWPRLTEGKEKLPFLSLDFDHWTDSSSAESPTGELCSCKVLA